MGRFYSRTNFFGSNLLCINFLTVGFHVFYVLLTEHEFFQFPSIKKKTTTTTTTLQGKVPESRKKSHLMLLSTVFLPSFSFTGEVSRRLP